MVLHVYKLHQLEKEFAALSKELQTAESQIDKLDSKEHEWNKLKKDSELKSHEYV